MVVTNVGDNRQGEFTVVTTIEIWAVNDDGLVTGLRVFPFSMPIPFQMPT
jgi:hypothetical protein